MKIVDVNVPYTNDMWGEIHNDLVDMHDGVDDIVFSILDSVYGSIRREIEYGNSV